VNKIIIGSDHAGFPLKEAMKATLDKLGIPYTDIGPECDAAVDYPDYAAQVARRVSDGEFLRGILVCGSGAGMTIVANKFPRVRAALCLTEDMARLCRLHNNTNILVLAGRITEPEKASAIVNTWLNTVFEGGRHERRLEKIRELEIALCK
jgi:ribose 5-phosphate isomerase B